MTNATWVISLWLINSAQLASSKTTMVGSCQQFADIGKSPNGVYFVYKDIDCKGRAFIPIDFGGEIHSNGKVISNISIRRQDENGVGIFRSICSKIPGKLASINNLKFRNIQISGKDTVGLLAGSMSSALINEVEISGSIRGRDFVGGVFGVMSGGGFIDHLRIESKINGENHVGGVVGNLSFGAISNTYSRAEIVGGNVVGGIASKVTNSNLNFTCTAGKVTGKDTVGGIAGILDGKIRQWLIPKEYNGAIHDYVYDSEISDPYFGAYSSFDAFRKIPLKYSCQNPTLCAPFDGTMKFHNTIFQANTNVEILAHSVVGGFVGAAIDTPLGIAMSSSSAFIRADESAGAISGAGTFASVNQSISLAGMSRNSLDGSPLFGAGSGSIIDVFVPNQFGIDAILAALYDSVWLDRKITHPSYYYHWLPKSDTDFVTGYRVEQDRRLVAIGIIPITRKSYDKIDYDYSEIRLSNNQKISRHYSPGEPPIFRTIPAFSTGKDTLDLKAHLWNWENKGSLLIYGNTACLSSNGSKLIRKTCSLGWTDTTFFCIRTNRFTGSCYSSKILFMDAVIIPQI